MPRRPACDPHSLRRGARPAAPLEPLPAHFDDDHLPFARRGLRAILPLVDLRFGRRAAGGTHTPSDAPPYVSRESLGRAGAFVLALLRSLAVEP